MSDKTADRIRAYLASVEPRDCAFESKDYRNGFILIERLAASAVGSKVPTLDLTPTECADVVGFIAMSDPVSRDDWFDDNGKTSHLVGLNMVMYAVEDSLRATKLKS